MSWSSAKLLVALGATALGLASPLRTEAVGAAVSVVVPLQLVDIGDGATKVGVEIGLGGGPPRLYELDTGAAGFYAAYGAAWWPSFEVVCASRPGRCRGSTRSG